jgi:hypothetical protein
METERGTTQEFNRFPFAHDLHEIQPVFLESDFGLGITSGLLVIQPAGRCANIRCFVLRLSRGVGERRSPMANVLRTPSPFCPPVSFTPVAPHGALVLETVDPVARARICVQL